MSDKRKQLNIGKCKDLQYDECKRLTNHKWKKVGKEYMKKC